MKSFFRQPGETGMENLNNAGLTVREFDYINDKRSLRIRKMKLDSIIFCLCLGMCSSTLIDSAFSMYEDPFSRQDERGKMDFQTMYLASQYFDSLDDHETLVISSKKWSKNMEKYFYNPVSVTPENAWQFYPNLRTLRIYNEEDLEVWRTYTGDVGFMNVEVHFSIDYRRAKDLLPELQDLLYEYDGSLIGNTPGIHTIDEPGRVKFFNVIIDDPNVVSEYDVGRIDDKTHCYTFNDEFDSGKNNGWTYRFEEIQGLLSGNRVVESIKMPYGLKVLGWGLFTNCVNLKSIEIPESVTKIDYAAFRRCGVTNLKLPVNLASIEYEAFHSCSILESMILPSRLLSICSYVFKNCCFKTIDIPNSVTKIDRKALNYRKLESITVHSERVRQLVLASGEGKINPDIIHVVTEENRGAEVVI